MQKKTGKEEKRQRTDRTKKEKKYYHCRIKSHCVDHIKCKWSKHCNKRQKISYWLESKSQLYTVCKRKHFKCKDTDRLK